jgi:hypothetical protein
MAPQMNAMTNRFLLCGFCFLGAAAFADDFTGQFAYHKKTQYFDFYAASDSPKIQEITRFADGFVRLVNRDFFTADFDYPIQVLVFPTREQFKQFMIERLHIPDPPNFGIYEYANKFFATYEDSGLGTFAHEILHPLVERNLNERSRWAIEGIPTFFEKFYGYWDGNELVAYWGYQNPWRIAQLGGNLQKLDLKQVLADPTHIEASVSAERGESAWRMASVFLWQQGRFKRFLNLIAKHERAGFPTYFEGAMKMPIEKIIPIWQWYLDDVAGERGKIMRLPPSSVFGDQAAFRSFVNAHDISLAQAKEAAE